MTEWDVTEQSARGLIRTAYAENQRRLKAAFPEYLAKYRELEKRQALLNRLSEALDYDKNEQLDGEDGE